MFHNRYEPIDPDIWEGRVDSSFDYDAFRWHQWVTRLDLRSDPEAIPGQLKFAFLGFRCDEGIRRNHGRIGAEQGPVVIRKAMSNLPCRFTEDVRLYDAGDVFCRDGNLEASQAALAQAVQKILARGCFPIVLGGGHEVALGHYMGHDSYYRRQQVKPDTAVINFDAHFDIRPLPTGGSSGTMFRQIAEHIEAQNEIFRYMVLGIQESANTIDLFKRADALGVSYLLEKDIVHLQEYHVLERLDEFLKRTERVYVSVCADVFSAAFAPGVSSTQAVGMEPEQMLIYLKHIIHSGKVVGMDIAEVSPRFDNDDVTASLAKILIFATVNSIAFLRGFMRT